MQGQKICSHPFGIRLHVVHPRCEVRAREVRAHEVRAHEVSMNELKLRVKTGDVTYPK